MSTFVILPQDNSPYGTNFIQWTKKENNTDARYGELTPSSFKLVKNSPTQYQITLSTILSQAPIIQQSGNITVSLPISPSKPLQITLRYGKSPECISFSTNPLVFQPGGQTSFTFTYNSKQCAVSDFIYLSVSAPY